VLPPTGTHPLNASAPTANGVCEDQSVLLDSVASTYQPLRVWASVVSSAWTMAFALTFIGCGAHWKLYGALYFGAAAHGGHRLWWMTPAYMVVYFTAYSLWCYPVEMWFGYLAERQFGLAKEGIRAWTRDWTIGVSQHGMMFVAGSSLLVIMQGLAPATWLAWVALILLGLFLATTWLAADLLPQGLFEMEPCPAQTRERLAALLPPAWPDLRLPRRIMAFSSPSLREFSGGLIGLGRRRVLLLSRPTLLVADDTVLRLVLLREIGRSRCHHMLISALAGWVSVAAGLAISNLIIPAAELAWPPYIPCLAVTLSLWMALGEPILACLGRRLEYQADRFYLRHGGSYEEMRHALTELCRRNLARTDGIRRRNAVFHPMPSVANRLERARAMNGNLET